MCESDFKMTPKERSFEPIRMMEMKLEAMKDKWLEKHGWEYSCDYVDHCWRWSKLIKGKLMACGMNQAVRIERDHID